MSFPGTGMAVVVGAGGSIGAALAAALAAGGRFSRVVALSRPALDLTDEASIIRAAAALGADELRLVIVASGFLHGQGWMPEKSWRQLDAAHLAHAFAINSIGPALLLKHFLPLLPRRGKAVFATLSARVGSISDNRLGGWYGYRAAKAALNQLVHCAAIELARSHPEALCVTLHPGTVDSRLSRPFSKAGLALQPPDQAATRLLAAIDGLTAAQSGGFFDADGQPIPW